MDLKGRVRRLEGQHMPDEPLTDDERQRLIYLSNMERDHPEYDLLEHLELQMKTRPGITFEQYLRESEAIRA